MTISVVFDFPDARLSQYEEVFTLGGDAIVNQPERLHHQCFESGRGFTVVDLWASEDAFTRFGEVIGPILQQLGLSQPPKVHRTRRVVTRTGEVVDY